jgi:tetratricopeptide (TPR) repeat protein
MPNLAKLIDRGVRGNITTLSPMLSPMLWTSIATGKLGDKHGILGFTEPDGQGAIRPVSSTSRRHKALWNVLSQCGLKSSVVGWFASHPAEPIKGCVFTDRFQQTIGNKAAAFPLDAHAVHPPELLSVAADLQIDPAELTDAQVGPFVPALYSVDDTKDRRVAAVAKVLAEATTIHNAATYLAEHEPSDLLAVYYDAIDHMGHGFMEYHPPRMDHVSEADAAIYGHVMTGIYQFHDLMLGRLLQLAGEETTVILLSDHGFHSGAGRPPMYPDPSDPGKLIGPGADPLAWHRRQGIFVAAGPNLKKDELVHGVSLLDVMPTVLMLLGLPIPGDIDGRPLTQIVDGPVELDRIDSYEPPHPDDGVHRGEAIVTDPFQVQQALQQLVDLGYIAPLSDDSAKVIADTLFDRKNVLSQIYMATGRVAEATALLREMLAERVGPGLKCRLAMLLIESGELEEAESLLDSIHPSREDMPVVLLLKGQAKYARGQFEKAYELYAAALEANPKFPEIHVYLGRVHLRQQRWSLAEESFRRALERDPDHAEARDSLGVALYAQQKFEDALHEHMKAVSLDSGRAETHINLGMAATALRQFDWAIRAFQVASELAPAHPFPHRCLAHLYANVKGKPDDARRHAEQADRLRANATARVPVEPTLPA